MKTLLLAALREPPLDNFPTPICSDAELEAWGRWYHDNSLSALGIRFLVFMQAPLAFAGALMRLLPGLKRLPCGVELLRFPRLSAGERYRLAAMLRDEMMPNRGVQTYRVGRDRPAQAI